MKSIEFSFIFFQIASLSISTMAPKRKPAKVNKCVRSSARVKHRSLKAKESTASTNEAPVVATQKANCIPKNR